jgi:hypothetical protein
MGVSCNVAKSNRDSEREQSNSEEDCNRFHMGSTA